MNARTKLWVALLVAVSMIGAATVLANTIYLPVIVKSPTITPTTTATVTPTVTYTPSATPTRTATPQPGINIADIVYDPANPLDEYIEIENSGSSDVDMENWAIKSDSSGYRYEFPDFTLDGGDSVKVWTKNGTNTSTNLYMGQSEEIWDDNHDTAYLRDADNDIVDTYTY